VERVNVGGELTALGRHVPVVEADDEDDEEESQDEERLTLGRVVRTETTSGR